MNFWREFHSVSEDLASFLGFGLNVLLLIVIKKIKIKALQKYNILLFQCCCVDLIQVTTSFIVKPVVVFHERSEYYLTNGFLRPIGGWIEMLGMCLWTVSLYFCINSMPVSFIFRYRTLCLDEKISKKFYIISLTLAALSASSFGVVVWKFHYLDNGHLTYLAEKNLHWLATDDGKVKAISVCPRETVCIWFTVVDSFFVTFIPYTIMLVYYIKIRNYFRDNQFLLSPSSRKVHADLNRVLLAEATVPIFSAFLPTTIHLTGAISNFDLVFTSFICGLMYSWIPVGNAICVFFFVTAYREKLKELLLRAKPKLRFLHSVSATVSMN